MLVLTRRIGESIIIGDGIKLTVVNVGPGRVKIGIEAPPSVRVDREEVHSRIQHEKASDVFEAVSAGTTSIGTGADQPTMVTAGPDTDVLHTGETTNANTAPKEPAHTPATSRLSQFRRKPR